MDYYNNETILNQAREIESLRQQLVSVTKERDEIAAKARMLDRMVDERDEQLAAALAACEAKDDCLLDCAGNINPERGYADELELDIAKALTIKPDSSALKVHDDALIEK